MINKIYKFIVRKKFNLLFDGFDKKFISLCLKYNKWANLD